jgi:hypothetical protein
VLLTPATIRALEILAAHNQVSDLLPNTDILASVEHATQQYSPEYRPRSPELGFSASDPLGHSVVRTTTRAGSLGSFGHSPRSAAPSPTSSRFLRFRPPPNRRHSTRIKTFHLPKDFDVSNLPRPAQPNLPNPPISPRRPYSLAKYLSKSKTRLTAVEKNIARYLMKSIYSNDPHHRVLTIDDVAAYLCKTKSAIERVLEDDEWRIDEYGNFSKRAWKPNRFEYQKVDSTIRDFVARMEEAGIYRSIGSPNVAPTSKNVDFWSDGDSEEWGSDESEARSDGDSEMWADEAPDDPEVGDREDQSQVYFRIDPHESQELEINTRDMGKLEGLSPPDNPSAESKWLMIWERLSRNWNDKEAEKIVQSGMGTKEDNSKQSQKTVKRRARITAATSRKLKHLIMDLPFGGSSGSHPGPPNPNVGGPSRSHVAPSDPIVEHGLYEGEPVPTPPSQPNVHPTTDGYLGGWYRDGDHLGLPSSAEASSQPMNLLPTTKTIPATCSNSLSNPKRAWPSLRLTKKQRALNEYWIKAAAIRKTGFPRSQWKWKDPEPRNVSGLWDNLPTDIQPPVHSSSQNESGRPVPTLNAFQFQDYLKRSRRAFEEKCQEMHEETFGEKQQKALIYSELNLKFHPEEHPWPDFQQTGVVDFSVPYWGEEIVDRSGKGNKGNPPATGEKRKLT